MMLPVALLLALAMLPMRLHAQATPTATPAAPVVAAAPLVATPAAQVRADLRILEWQLDNAVDFDFALLFHGAPGSNLASADLTFPAANPLSQGARLFLEGLDTGQGSFEAVIEALQTAGKVNVMSEPSVVMTIGAEPAKVLSGTSVPFAALKTFGVTPTAATEFRDTGVVMSCSAKPVPYRGLVHLDIDASITDLTGYINIAKDPQGHASRVPVLDQRKMRNQVIVRDKSIFISGLLKSTRQTERKQGVPYLGEVPGLRNFFGNRKSENKVVELVFLVRPEIMNPRKEEANVAQASVVGQ